MTSPEELHAKAEGLRNVARGLRTEAGHVATLFDRPNELAGDATWRGEVATEFNEMLVSWRNAAEATHGDMVHTAASFDRQAETYDEDARELRRLERQAERDKEHPSDRPGRPGGPR